MSSQTPSPQQPHGVALRGVPGLAFGARPYPPSPPERAQSARYNPSRRGETPRVQSARRPCPPQPPPVALGVGTQGLGEACNSELASVAKQLQRRWLRARVRELSIAKATRAASYGHQFSPQERYTSAKQERERKKELEEEHLDQVNAKIAKEYKLSKARAKEAKLQIGQELITRVAQDKESRKQRMTTTWQWLGWEDTQSSMASPLWHDFCPRDSDRIEEAYQEGCTSIEVADSVFLSGQSGARLMLRLKPDDEKKRWAENSETKERWPIRRVHRIRTPQNGGLSPQREQRMEHERRILAAVMEQMHQEAVIAAERRRDLTREERENRLEQQEKLRQMMEDRQKGLRETVLRDRKRMKRKTDRIKRDYAEYFEQWQDTIKRERAEYKARKECRDKEKEIFCEKRQRAQKSLLAKEGERRKDINTAHTNALVESVKACRSARARQLEDLRAEVVPASVPLSLGQWRVRQERLEAGMTLRGIQQELRSARELDRQLEYESKVAQRRQILEADERRRVRGIVAGGGGLGEASGGVVVVSPPGPRRSPRRLRAELSDEEE
eukprot:TRINITY_DN21558_c0_g1_i1.p1 TRINITY_DN21558_c0_g1~~TRINITY_DN21558_c0_g1_i1.p1  ORF type:complete len:557 (+),score=99.39 TRINITY_DN21558_c0_g1_i1:173-1843(+)